MVAVLGKGRMLTARVVVLTMVCACGDVSDGMKMDATVPSDGSASPRCNPDSPFGAPVPISEINTAASEEGADLSADELTMYFSSTRTGTLGGYDIFMATRPTRTAPWGNIVAVTGVNTAGGNERFPMVTGDGLTMYAMIGVTPNYEIGIAARTSTAAAFSALAVAATINGGSNDEGGTILPDQRAIWFSSNRSGQDDLYRAPRSGGQFGNPLLVSGTDLNDPSAEDSQPAVTPDELTLFFSSARMGGVGGNDIWMARRRSVADGFDVPVNVQTVNTTGIDVPTWVSADGCVLYIFTGPAGAYDLSVATRGM